MVLFSRLIINCGCRPVHRSLGHQHQSVSKAKAMASHTDSFNLIRSTKLENEYRKFESGYRRTLESLNVLSLDPPSSAVPSPSPPSERRRPQSSAGISSEKVIEVAEKGAARTGLTGRIDHGIQEVVQSRFVSRILARLDAHRARFKERELTPDEIRELCDRPLVRSTSYGVTNIRDLERLSGYPGSEIGSVINHSESSFHQKEDDAVAAPPSDLGRSPNSIPDAGSLSPLADAALEFPDTTCAGQSIPISQSAAEVGQPALAPPNAFSEGEGTGSWSTENDHSDRPQESSVKTRCPDFHAQRPRQVGIATIRVESVCPARMHTKNNESSSCDSQDVSFYSDPEGKPSNPKDNESRHGGAEDHDRCSHTIGDAPEAAGSSGSGGSRGLPVPSSTGAEDGRESGEEDDQGPRKPSSKNPVTSPKPNSPRYACPYQAFEPGRPCLRRSSRNPMGGSDGLVRLRYESVISTI